MPNDPNDNSNSSGGSSTPSITIQDVKEEIANLTPSIIKQREIAINNKIKQLFTYLSDKNYFESITSSKSLIESLKQALRDYNMAYKASRTNNYELFSQGKLTNKEGCLKTEKNNRKTANLLLNGCKANILNLLDGETMNVINNYYDQIESIRN